MKYLHVIQANERNSYQLFHQMHERYDLSDHVFFVCNYKDVIKKHFPKFLEFKNFIYVEEKWAIQKALKLYKLFKEADHIILHSLIFTTKKYLYFIYFFRKFLTKATWIEWGADLYNWKLPGNSIKEKFINHINWVIRKNILQVGLTFEVDEEEIRRQMGEKVNCIYTPLPFAENRIKLLEESRTKKLNQKKEIRIQVAHNSLQLNNHINILSQLEKYRENNIRVILPLSYGTYGINGQFGGFAYRKSVIQCAYSFIGKNKVSILSKELPLEKYLQYLWNIDIAVFNVNRPIGLANIIYMLYMGKKVFLPANSPHYKFFKETGLPVFKTEDIDFMTYDEFIRPVDTQVSNWIIKRLSPGEGIKNWDNLFLKISGETYVKNNHL